MVNYEVGALVSYFRRPMRAGAVVFINTASALRSARCMSGAIYVYAINQYNCPKLVRKLTPHTSVCFHRLHVPVSAF